MTERRYRPLAPHDRERRHEREEHRGHDRADRDDDAVGEVAREVRRDDERVVVERRARGRRERVRPEVLALLLEACDDDPVDRHEHDGEPHPARQPAQPVGRGRGSRSRRRRVRSSAAFAAAGRWWLATTSRPFQLAVGASPPPRRRMSSASARPTSTRITAIALAGPMRLAWKPSLYMASASVRVASAGPPPVSTKIRSKYVSEPDEDQRRRGDDRVLQLRERDARRTGAAARRRRARRPRTSSAGSAAPRPGRSA